MTIPFACSCGKSFQAKDEFAGKRTKCPACGQVLVIPQEPQTEASPAPAPPKVTPRPEAAPVAATNPWDDVDTPTEKNVDDRPHSKKRRARRRSPALLIVVGVLAIAVVGAGGGGGYLLWKQFQEAGKPIDRSGRIAPTNPQKAADNDPNEAASKVDLGEDLNLVPKNAVGFVAVRVADWMASPLIQQLRKQPLALLMPDPDKELERQLGLKPADIERVTIVAPGLSPAYWAIVYTRKPYDQAKILQLLGPTEERQLKGKTYRYSDAHKMAVYFPKDRLLITGPDEGVRQFLAPPEALSKEMSIPLKLAATERHHITGALHVPPILLTALPIPPELSPFQPILNTSGLMLTLDGAEGLHMSAKLDYVDEASAKKAEEAANGLLKWGREQLAQVKQTLSAGPDGPAMQPALKLVDSLVEKIPITRQGKTVEVQWQVDAKIVASAPALLLPAVQKVRMAADRLKTTNNLKQLALAMLNYHDKHGHFPPAVVTAPDGRPLYSWRVELLPFMQQDALYQEFKKDEPWDSPHNRKLLAKMPPVFALSGVANQEPSATFFQVLVGPGTPFGGEKPSRLPGDFPGGTSNTLLIVTAAEAVPWTKPADLVFDPKGPLPKFGRQLSPGTPVVFADGSARVLEPTTNDQVLRDWIAPVGASAK